MKLSNFSKMSFGIGALGKDLCYAVISYFLMIYFTDTIGLTPLFVGNLFLVARIWDAFNDPMMGFIVDNTRTRWGKFRPWILIGTLLNAVILVFLFRKPEGLGTTGMYAYFSIMYILWGMTYTVMDIPYWSMLPSLSSTKKERDSISVIPRIFTTSAQFAEIGGLFIFPIISRFLSKKQVFAIASFSPAIGLIGLVVSGFFIPQNVVVIGICGVLYKLGSGLTLGATTVMLADVIDYGEVKLGTRNESIIASFQTLLVKTASAVSAWLIGISLTVVGYVANAEQTASTIMGMRVLMGVVPAVLTILAFVIYAKGYKLEGVYLEDILNKVKSKKEE